MDSSGVKGMDPIAPAGAMVPEDAYNLDQGWFDTDYIGIDKGISLLMIANYENGFVWNLFMKNEAVRKGLENLGFTEKQDGDAPS